MAEPVLRAQQLVRVTGSMPVLNGMDVSLSAGKVLAVMGANGAGKSTLLSVLAGLWSFSGGTLTRFGEVVPPDNWPDPRVGLLAHQTFLYGHMSLDENLRFYGGLYGVTHPAERAAWAAGRVGLGWARRDLVRTFSRGMQQRAALARLLMQDAGIWLLDEPASGLDATGRTALFELIAEQRARGTAVVMTTHAIQDAVRVADVLAILRHGRFVWWSDQAESWVSAYRHHLEEDQRHA